MPEGAGLGRDGTGWEAKKEKGAREKGNRMKDN
eukprot:CAMPEP_0117658580 /NCGR_PEP_ID=MMETSP0804-20121206/5937_1 /TAXON_ID=1074897 /ORGANISM="Tetraselmis astigmatica, Strain CCMP880" /LENGTH=32 /DNA_ID= /DNA_START= /DNA_END= /DNA_ORIENTATION=